jgi:thiosulfate reductase cytochrome b subunit
MACALSNGDTFFSTTTQIIQWECTNAWVYIGTLLVYFVVNVAQEYTWAHLLQLKRSAQRIRRGERNIHPLVMWQLVSTSLSSITILMLVSKNFGIIITGIMGHATGIWWVYSHQTQDEVYHQSTPYPADARRDQRNARVVFG